MIGMPVLRLKSDYFAIATLGFAEVVRIVTASSWLNKVTNGSLGLNSIPKFNSYYAIFHCCDYLYRDNVFLIKKIPPTAERLKQYATTKSQPRQWE
ncbi:MAG: hypothetical protein L6V93_18555 [Clostridiales bacterium]|nr:MAG: hypothetical protein L6V93_18555 [Clostridiales bacterium]